MDPIYDCFMIPTFFNDASIIDLIYLYYVINGIFVNRKSRTRVEFRALTLVSAA